MGDYLSDDEKGGMLRNPHTPAPEWSRGRTFDRPLSESAGEVAGAAPAAPACAVCFSASHGPPVYTERATPPHTPPNFRRSIICWRVMQCAHALCERFLGGSLAIYHFVCARLSIFHFARSCFGSSVRPFTPSAVHLFPFMGGVVTGAHPLLLYPLQRHSERGSFDRLCVRDPFCVSCRHGRTRGLSALYSGRSSATSIACVFVDARTFPPPSLVWRGFFSQSAPPNLALVCALGRPFSPGCWYPAHRFLV